MLFRSNTAFGSGPDVRWEFPVATERPYSYARTAWAPTGRNGFYTWHGELTASVNNVARTGSTATLTTSAAHGFAAGDSVTVSGLTNSALNGTYTITTAPTSTTFTYTTATTGTAAIFNTTLTGGINIGQAVTGTINIGSSTSTTAAGGALSSGTTLTVGTTATITGSTLNINGTNPTIATSQTTGTAALLNIAFTGAINIGGGSSLPVAGYSCVTGYIADFRVTKGIARYTTTFTPPTAPLKTK